MLKYFIATLNIPRSVARTLAGTDVLSHVQMLLPSLSLLNLSPTNVSCVLDESNLGAAACFYSVIYI